MKKIKDNGFEFLIKKKFNKKELHYKIKKYKETSDDIYFNDIYECMRNFFYSILVSKFGYNFHTTLDFIDDNMMYVLHKSIGEFDESKSSISYNNYACKLMNYRLINHKKKFRSNFYLDDQNQKFIKSKELLNVNDSNQNIFDPEYNYEIKNLCLQRDKKILHLIMNVLNHKSSYKYIIQMILNMLCNIRLISVSDKDYIMDSHKQTIYKSSKRGFDSNYGRVVSKIRDIIEKEKEESNYISYENYIGFSKIHNIIMNICNIYKNDVILLKNENYKIIEIKLKEMYLYFVEKGKEVLNEK